MCRRTGTLTTASESVDASKAAAGPGGPNPGNIMQVATGFWASKVLLEAIDFDLFTVLAAENEGKGLTAAQVAAKVGWDACHKSRPVAVQDFLNSLLALGFLLRHDSADGNAAQHLYANGEDVAVFLNKASPAYIGGFLSMLNARLYGFWGNLGDALKTGKPQNELRGSPADADLWADLYASAEQTEGFLKAMSAFQMGNYMAICGPPGAGPAWKSPLDDVFGCDDRNDAIVYDWGGADATLACMIAQRWPHLKKVVSMDLAPALPFAQKHIKEMSMGERVQAVAGSFFEPLADQDDAGNVDVIVLGNILHDWSVEDNMKILRNAHDMLARKGMLVVIENVIDDEKKANVPGLLMSLNMLIETTGGANFSAKEFKGWAREAGFVGSYQSRMLAPGAAAVMMQKA